MKIAFIKPPATYADWYKQPALGISYISAYLESKGLDCRIFDAYFNRWSVLQLLHRVINFKPDLIGITAMTHEVIQAGEIAASLKKYLDAPIVVGGPHASALPERTLTEFPSFDYVVVGEGEPTVFELAGHLKHGNSQETSLIRGLAFRRDKSVIINEPRPFLNPEELSLLPYPAYHQYYKKHTTALAAKQSYYIMFAGRGCPYRCIFCMRVLGDNIRRRSAENICLEIEQAISIYGVHTINFADEIFLFANQNSQQLLELMIHRGLSKRIRWSGLVHASIVNPQLIELAKESGCYRLEMGIESADDQILQAIGKRVNVVGVKKAVDIIKKAGISLSAYFIMGHPNETRETLEKTYNLATQLNIDTIAVGLMVPYPGTKIFDMALRGEGGYRILTQDWSQYDKYFAESLEIKDLSHKELKTWQRRTYIDFYLKNFKFMQAISFFWKRRKAVRVFINKLAIELVNYLKSFHR